MMIKYCKKYTFLLVLCFSFCLFWSDAAVAWEDFNFNPYDNTFGGEPLGMGYRCDIVAIQKDYMSSCFSCATVGTIISVFLEVGAKAYPLMRSAGNTLLGILSVLWIAIFLLKNLSQFNAIELPSFVQQLAVFLFKVMVAFVCLNGGIDVILEYTLNPIIAFGTDFGYELLKMTSQASAEDYLNLLNNLNGTEVLHA